jgi:hypothetical protein
MNTAVSIILASVVTIIMVVVAATTELLRESPSVQQSPPVTPPYSFSRFQLFLWTLVIVPLFALGWGHVGLGCATCKPATYMINTTALILLGISAGTAVSAGVVSSAQQNATTPAPVKANSPSAGFWADILADNNGNFSMARLQQLVFTIVFIGIFITEFFPTFQFPKFDSEVFVLMGISTGSYVLGKSLNV